MWLSSEGPEKTNAVRGPGLSAKLHVRYSQLGQLPHQTRSGPRQVSSEAVSSEAVSSEAVISEVVSSEAVSSEVVSSEAVSSSSCTNC